MIDTDNMISVEEDDRITAEEAAKTPEQINAETLAVMTAAYNRRGDRLLKANYLISRLDMVARGIPVRDLDEAWSAYRKAMQFELQSI